MFEKLTELLDGFVGHGTPGCDLAIYHKGRCVYRYFPGFSDEENNIPMNGRELYNLYSCSKVITVTAALILWERGAFELSDRLEKYMPEFTNMTVRCDDGGVRSAEKSITVEDLFCMTAGLDYATKAPEIVELQRVSDGRCATRDLARYLAKTMTRAMFVTVLGRLAGIDADEAASRYGTTSTFTDVSSSDASISYAVPYIKWASDNGLIEGYGNGKFGPKDNITHAQMYVLMQRYAAFIERQNTNVSIITIPANDVKDIPEWANDAVKYAAKNDFLITSSNRLTPNGNAKRSELAMLLEKFCVNVMGWED